MESILNLLNSLMGSGAGSVILVAIFASVFLVVLAVSGLIGQRNPVKRRLAGQAAPIETATQWQTRAALYRTALENHVFGEMPDATDVEIIDRKLLDDAGTGW